MSTKATIQASINTINDGGSNTAAEVRAVFNSELDNAYGTVVTETYTTVTDITPNTTPAGSGKHYDIKLVKQGRCVTVSGTIESKLSFILSNIKWFDINAGEYLPDATKPIYFHGFTIGDGTPVRFALLGSQFKLISALGRDKIVMFNFKYFTQD